jgi:hypothetical protein
MVGSGNRKERKCPGFLSLAVLVLVHGTVSWFFYSICKKRSKVGIIIIIGIVAQK